MKRCPRCKEIKPIEKFGKHANTKDGHRVWCRPCNNQKAKEYYAKNSQKYHERYMNLKREFIEAYDGKCYCCGETAIAFLTLDHIHGGGYKERLKEGTGTQIYLRLRKAGYPKDKYRCACMNCNLAVAYGRTCPHKKGKE